MKGSFQRLFTFLFQGFRLPLRGGLLLVRAAALSGVSLPWHFDLQTKWKLSTFSSSFFFRFGSLLLVAEGREVRNEDGGGEGGGSG